MQIASDEAKKAAKEAEAEKRRRLYADYVVQPEGFSLSTKEEDQNTFTRLIALINTASIQDSAPLALSDSKGKLHIVTAGRIKEILTLYGLEIFNRWKVYKS